MQARDDLLGAPSRGIRWALGLWAAAIAVFTIIAVTPLRDLAQPVDDWFWDIAVETEWQPAVVAAKGLHIIGSGWVMIPFEIALGVLLFARRRLTALIFWVAAVVTSEVIVWTSKAIYGRQRPPDALVSTTGNSFPSAHAATAAVVAIGLVLLLICVSERRWYWYAAAAGWATMMAASRVYLRAHWFSDVVAGAAVGAAVVITFALLIGRWRDPREDQPNKTAEE
jgi:undecaprenyl-diphosphatase